MEHEATRIRQSLEMIEDRLSIISRYYELKFKSEFPDEDL